MWPSNQNYNYPYPPTPEPPGKKNEKTILTVIIVIVVIFIMISGFFFVYVMVFNNDFGTGYNYGYDGFQTYNGSTNKSEIMNYLNNASFGARENPTNMGDIRFHPFCGVKNTSQASETSRMMSTSYTSINGETITVRLRTAFLNSSSKSKLENGLSCVMTRMRSIYTDEMGLVFLDQHTTEKRNKIPGFEVTGFVIAVAIVIYFKRYRILKNEDK